MATHFSGPLSGIALYLLPLDRSKPGRPAGSGDCTYVQDGQEQVRIHRTKLDPEICHGLKVLLESEIVRGHLAS